jgi:hypothetical protein
MIERPNTDVLTVEDAKNRVFHMVAELCSDGSCPIQPVLDRCVSDAVEARWSNPVKTFVPLLAFREVQECIRLGYCPERPVEPTA